MSIGNIDNKISDFLNQTEKELKAEILSRIPDQDCQVEAERLRRPEKPKPSPEAEAEAARLLSAAAELKKKVAAKIENEILPMVDEIVTAHNQAAALELTIPNFMLANYLNDLKGIFNKYQNAVVMGRRPVPAASDVAGTKKKS